MSRETILIIDDAEMNRSILTDILGDNYNILEAEDGVQAVEILEQRHAEIDLVLLDVVMPRMDGFGVLDVMNAKHWIDDIPVIMVSAERELSQMERAYTLGVTDFIVRPFDPFIVCRRVSNTLLIYSKQKRLTKLVEEQLREREKYSRTMVNILSHIVEVRNGESGLHVLHVRAITDFFLRKLMERTDCYRLSEEDLVMMSDASALHDIGKICIDEAILNKPGRLTAEEFEVMKTHTVIGAEMLESEPLHQDNPLLEAAYQICRWHHERYDGRGYPDGLKGEEIPIAAQVVALADVYDALTAERVYKSAFDHETAVRMIINGECGAFNPLLMDCLRDHADELEAKLEQDVAVEIARRDIRNIRNSVISTGFGKAMGLPFS